jgi:pilus assembly protein Flp/PilA
MNTPRALLPTTCEKGLKKSGIVPIDKASQKRVPESPCRTTEVTTTDAGWASSRAQSFIPIEQHIGKDLHTMQNIMFWINFQLAQLRDREEGATAVEYGLMVGLIAVAIIATVVLLGDQLNQLFQGVTDELGNVLPLGGGA